MENEQFLSDEGWQGGTSAGVSDAPPTPAEKKTYVRAKLQTANDIASELARVYRAMKSGELDPNVGTKLTYVLATLAKIRSDSELEARIERLEQKGLH